MISDLLATVAVAGVLITTGINSYLHHVADSGLCQGEVQIFNQQSNAPLTMNSDRLDAIQLARLKIQCGNTEHLDNSRIREHVKALADLPEIVDQAQTQIDKQNAGS